jgi:phenylacetic acid degradation protein paaN
MTVSQDLFEQHRDRLEQAIEAIHQRGFHSAFPETPSKKIYGEHAADEGRAAFEARLNAQFAIDQPGVVGWIGDERSPFGLELGVRYPQCDLDVLIPAAHNAMRQWRRLDVEHRTGLCMEMLDRLNRRSFELAWAVMHTTGQAYMMAFQAGGPHAQDRALEAIAYAHHELKRIPSTASWSKRVSKDDTVRLEKTYRIMPRGVAVNIGCSTFPTWNGYPGLFASLVTGNAVVVKPHPGAILPLAITIETIRSVLVEQGMDPNVVTLAVDSVEAPSAKDLVMRHEVGIVDYTGGSEFGSWIEENARHAVVYTEKAGVNSIIIDSAPDLRAMTGNIGFTLSLYSGQMCTASQNIFIPKDGCVIGGERMSFNDVARGIVKAADWLLGDPRRGAEVLGAIQNPRTVDRIEQAKTEGGTVLRDATPVDNELFPEARVRSPLIMQVDAADEHLYMREMFGPIVYIIATDSTDHSIELACRAAVEHGAITAAIYSESDAVLDDAADRTAEAGVPLSCNLTGHIWVNQAAAFSDYHVSGANPAGNATLCDAAFVANRFRVVQSRKPLVDAG